MIHALRIDSVQDLSQPSSLRGKADNNPSSRACFDSERVHGEEGAGQCVVRAGQGGAERIDALCTALQ